MDNVSSLTYVPIYILGKYDGVALWKQEYRRIFMERNSN
jgi:hypothetical protein